MAQLMLARLKHIHRFRDRHGTLRHYLRLPGCKSIALPGAPGSAEFLAAYTAGMAAAVKPPAGAARNAPGSLNAVAASWYGSRAFAGLAPATQGTYRRICERLRERHGTKPLALIDEVGIRKLLDEVKAHPTAPGHLLRVLRSLIAHAIEQGVMKTDPSANVKRGRHTVTGYRTWTEEEIAQFRAHWPSGTRQRLAFELLLCTGQRRSDVVRMGRQHVTVRTTAVKGRTSKATYLSIRQQKTGNAVVLPILPELAAELAQVPADRLTFLARDDGTAHTAGGFYNLFVAWCAEAGLPPGLSPHGLRKALGRRLAEYGATANEIAAALGHSGLSEVQTYTAAAEQARLAEAGLGRITNMNSLTRSGTLANRRKK